MPKAYCSENCRLREKNARCNDYHRAGTKARAALELPTSLAAVADTPSERILRQLLADGRDFEAVLFGNGDMRVVVGSPELVEEEYQGEPDEEEPNAEELAELEGEAAGTVAAPVRIRSGR